MRYFNRFLLWLLFFICLLHLFLFIYVVAGRITFPGDLEWMEGGMAVHALRLVESKPLYGPPSPGFMAFIYQPLYPALLACGFFFTGYTPVTGRLISVVATLVTALVIWKILSKRKASAFVGFIACLSYISLFSDAGFWMDIARVDNLLVLFTILSLAVLDGENHRLPRVVLSAVLGGAAFFTKQSAAFLFPAVAIALLFRSRRESFIFCLTSVFVCVVPALLLHIATDGWYTLYCFENPATHPYDYDYLPVLLRSVCFFRVPVFIAAFILLATLRLAFGGFVDIAHWLFSTVGAFAASVILRIHPGGFDNVLLPAWCLLCVCLGFFLLDIEMLDPLGKAPSRFRGFCRFWGLTLLIVQFSITLYFPESQLPLKHDRKAFSWLVEQIRQVKGPVLMPFHPSYPLYAGKNYCYHQMALSDLRRNDFMQIPFGLQKALSEQRYSAVFTINGWLPWEKMPFYYYQDHRLFWTSHCLRMPVGFQAQPCWVWRPRSTSVPSAFTRIDGRFEGESYVGWHSTGTAFSNGPQRGAFSGQNPICGYEGDRLVNTYYRSSDLPRGTLTSDDFTIKSDLITFLLGGGEFPDRVCANLLVDGFVRRTATGRNSEQLDRRIWKVASLKGKRARIQLVDRVSGGWGHLLFDDLRMTDVDYFVPDR